MTQHYPDPRRGSLEASATARFPAKAAFDAGRSRGLKDGANWARHLAATSDLRSLCDRPVETPLGADQLSALLHRYALQPRSLAAVAGHDPDQFDFGYSNGFQRGARSVWKWLCLVAAGLDELS